jgi:hypothetical protein
MNTNARPRHTFSERDLDLSWARDCILDVDINADYSISLAENYAWVDELLEKKYYDYISEDEDDISLNYETFSQNETQDQDQDETDFDMLISDLKNLISYHEDRKRRRNKQTDDVFALFNELNMDV